MALQALSQMSSRTLSQMSFRAQPRNLTHVGPVHERALQGRFIRPRMARPQNRRLNIRALGQEDEASTASLPDSGRVVIRRGFVERLATSLGLTHAAEPCEPLSVRFCPGLRPRLCHGLRHAPFLPLPKFRLQPACHDHEATPGFYDDYRKCCGRECVRCGPLPDVERQTRPVAVRRVTLPYEQSDACYE